MPVARVDGMRMRRAAAIAAAMVVVPAAAAAGPTATEAAPVQVAAAPGATDPVGPGGLAGEPETDTGAGTVLAPPGMMAPTAVDRPQTDRRPTKAEGLARRNQVDAASDRAFLMGSAITPGSGKVTATWRSVIGPSVGMAALSVGVTDRVEVGGHIIYGDDDESIKGGSVKVQVYRQARTAIAVEANLLGTDGDEVAGLASASLSHCIDAGCGAIASLHAGALLSSEESPDEQVPLLGGVSLVLGGGHIKFLTELLTIEIDHERLVGGMFGMRFSSRQFAFDIGTAFAVAGDGGGAIPVMALTLRP
jgi:hypothetical protein